jgi:hypothetical protein
MHATLDKSKLLDLIRAEYAFAERTLALLKPEQMEIGGVCGFWSAKDVIAHLMWWEEITLRWLADAERGIVLTVPEEGFGWDQFDELNDQYYQIHKDRSLEDILADFRRVQQAILAKVETMSDEELAGGGRYAGMFSDSPADAIAGDTHLHYQKHLAQIRAWLNGQT